MTNVIQKNTANCNAASNITQVVQATAGGDVVITNVTLSGSSYINSECLAEVENDSNLVTEMVNAVTAEVENKTTQSGTANINLSQSQIEIINTAISEFESNFDMENVLNCVSSVSAVQAIIANAGRNATIKDVSITMDSTVIQNCLLTGSNTQQQITDIASTLSAAASNSTAQGCFAGSDLSQLAIIIGVIVGIIVLLRVAFQKKGGGGAPAA